MSKKKPLKVFQQYDVVEMALINDGREAEWERVINKYEDPEAMREEAIELCWALVGQAEGENDFWIESFETEAEALQAKARFVGNQKLSDNTRQCLERFGWLDETSATDFKITTSSGATYRFTSLSAITVEQTGLPDPDYS